MNKSRTNLQELIQRIEPFDELERRDVEATFAWMGSTEDVFRRISPDVPRQHLVAYFVLVDHTRSSLLLVNHRKAGLWLPPGGHVEPGEDPYDTVRRELAEELGPKAQMVASVASLPLFLTVTPTRGVGTHNDVSFWYVVAGDERMWLDPDPREFSGHRWQSFDSILVTDSGGLEPNLHRFVEKLKKRLRAGAAQGENEFAS